METLGEVIVFSQSDSDRVRDLAIDLYRLRPVLENPSAPISGRGRRDYLFDGIAKGLARPKAVPVPANQVQNILLFRYDALGDYVATTPLIEWLKHAAPHANIDVIGSYRNARLLRSDPRIRNVIPMHPSHSFRPSWMRVYRAGQATEYDVVIAAVFTRMSKAAMLTRMASRTAVTATIRHEDRYSTYGKVFQVQVPHYGPEHWALTMSRIGPACIIPEHPVSPDVAVPRIPVDHNAASRVAQWLAERGLGWQMNVDRAQIIPLGPLPSVAGKPYVVVNVSAFSPNRQWAAEPCIATIRGIRERYPTLSVLVSAAPTEQDAARKIVREVGDANVYHWSGSIEELISVIAGASVMVSPDTATVHVAAACGVPCVVLFAELIKVAEWYPFNVPYRGILSADPSTISSIPPQIIVGAFSELL